VRPTFGSSSTLQISGSCAERGCQRRPVIILDSFITSPLSFSFVHTRRSTLMASGLGSGMHYQGSCEMLILSGATIAEIFKAGDRAIEPKPLEESSKSRSSIAAT
jgi:hypothetical protein